MNPITTERSMPAAPPVAKMASTILVVDDDRSIRIRLSQLLQGAGYSVIEAADGRAGLLAAQRAKALDAIVLDLTMPTTSGWQFRAVQLGDPSLVHIPTFVTTSRELTPHERYSLRITSTEVIQKPFDDAKVLNSLVRVFSEGGSANGVHDGRWRSRQGRNLLWSRDGRVACEAHAPSTDSEEWRTGHWTWIPRFAGKNKIEYACQECTGGPIVHAAARSSADGAIEI